MLLYDLTEFQRLSADLHLQLAARGVGWNNVLQIITNRMPLAGPRDRKILMRVFEFLDHAYEKRRREIGPPEILHALRATALLAQAIGQPHLLDLLTELLHDKFEDFTPNAMGQDRYAQMESEFRELLLELNPTDQWYLMERLECLTRGRDETYYHYIGRLLGKTRVTPELVRIKLADRLDNTLDLHIDLRDPLADENFFQVLFQVLFSTSDPSYRPPSEHPESSPLNGAKRLYQLFKNAVLLSMIREKNAAPEDAAARILFRSMALASMHEAQRIMLHIMGYHETSVSRQRELLMEVQRYAQLGGLTHTTAPSCEHPLDGLFRKHFDHPDSTVRSRYLDELYRNKGLMLQAALGFVVIFVNFVQSPDYWVKGISEDGIDRSGN